MRKTLDMTGTSERSGLRVLAAIALTGSLAAFGCSTNRMPGSGEPAKSAPAAGSVAPNASSTPGSSSSTTTTNGTPQAMISSSPAPASGFSASEDAVAVLKADEAFRGKNLGPASPGDINAPSASAQQVTGQFVSPSLTANPQVTVNSSISSPPTPAVGVGDGIGGGLTVAALPAGTTVTGGTTAVTSGITNTGTTGVSSTTASALVNTTSPVSNTAATAPLTTAAATPAMTTTGTTAAATTNAGGSTLGVTNVRGGVARPATTATPATTRTTSGTATGAIRIDTTSGAVVVTNAAPAESRFQRILTAIGLRHRAVTGGTTTTTTTTTPTPATTTTNP